VEEYQRYPTTAGPSKGWATGCAVYLLINSAALYQRKLYEGVSECFRTGCLVRELQMAQLSATRSSCVAILLVSVVTFAAITLCVASQRLFIVFISSSTQSGNF
jgi:hypothetical protein